MRQRNDTGYPQLVATQPPVVVEPGDMIDNPDPVIGFTLLPPEPAAADEPAAAVTAPKKVTPPPAPAADGQEASA